MNSRPASLFTSLTTRRRYFFRQARVTAYASRYFSDRWEKVSDETIEEGFDHGFRPRVDLEFFVDAANVKVDSIDRNAEF
jgi:hypothetical protein